VNRDGADSDTMIRRVIQAYEVLLFTKGYSIMFVIFFLPNICMCVKEEKANMV
jgi:hypothetical protein